MKVFVDTNVLLDVLAKREPFYNDSARVWSLVERGKIEALVSVISFNNVYYTVRQAASRKAADRALRLMRNVFVPVPPGHPDSEPGHRFRFRRLRGRDAVSFCHPLRRQLPDYPRYQPLSNGRPIHTCTRRVPRILSFGVTAPLRDQLDSGNSIRWAFHHLPKSTGPVPAGDAAPAR